MLPKITIVTPTFNSAAYIEECITSVLSQGYPNLEYIVVDGGSTDGTGEIINKYKDRIALYISEPDKGPADAINKGFRQSSGDIMCWLNSDDKMHSNSFFAVAEIFSAFNDVDWIMGYPTWYNAEGACLGELFVSKSNFFYTPNFINDSLHLKFACWSKWRFAMGDFSAIQQESVFWRRSLWVKAGEQLNEDLIAFDLELWTRFFQHAQLYTCNVLLAGFRVHGNQISVNQRERYQREANEIIGMFKRSILKGRVSRQLTLRVARALRFFYYYDIPVLNSLYPKLMDLPPFITFSPLNLQFEMMQQKYSYGG